jgi:hypothetical protein
MRLVILKLILGDISENVYGENNMWGSKRSRTLILTVWI